MPMLHLSFRSYANLLHDTSLHSGASIAPFIPALCRDLDIKAPKSQVFTGELGAKLTSTPILFLSTMLDPITPLVSAQKMQGKFGSAGLLVHNAAGHTVFSSNCTNSYVQQYIRDGSLPKEGTICPFNSAPSLSRSRKGRNYRH
jgi:hypothetical protein